MSRGALGEGSGRFMPQIDYMGPHREVHVYAESLFASSHAGPLFSEKSIQKRIFFGSVAHASL
jgi:hypothetical protein